MGFSLFEEEEERFIAPISAAKGKEQRQTPISMKKAEIRLAASPPKPVMMKEMAVFRKSVPMAKPAPLKITEVRRDSDSDGGPKPIPKTMMKKRSSLASPSAALRNKEMKSIPKATAMRRISTPSGKKVIFCSFEERRQCELLFESL